MVVRVTRVSRGAAFDQIDLQYVSDRLMTLLTTATGWVGSRRGRCARPRKPSWSVFSLQVPTSLSSSDVKHIKLYMFHIL